MHWVPMLLRDSGTLEGNSRDLFWMVTWKMICTGAQAMPLALCRPVPSRVRPCACRDRNRATCRSSTGPKRECAHLRICNRNRACQNLRGSSGRHPLYATLQGCIEAKCGNWHGAQRTCICIMPAHGRLPVLRRPVVSSSGGMCVTVPKVPVLMASCESTLLSPKSATCKHQQHVTAALHIIQEAQWTAAPMAWGGKCQTSQAALCICTSRHADVLCLGSPLDTSTAEYFCIRHT